MANASNKKLEAEKPPRSGRMNEALTLLLVSISVFLLVALLSYNSADPAWSHDAGQEARTQNICGPIGAWVADIGYYFFGLSIYLIPSLLLITAWHILRGPRDDESSHDLDPSYRLVSAAILMISIAGLGAMHGSGYEDLPAGIGGVLGHLFSGFLSKGIGDFGASLFFGVAALISLVFATPISWFKVIDKVGAWTLQIAAIAVAFVAGLPAWWAQRQARGEREEVRRTDRVKRAIREPVKIDLPSVPLERSERAKRERQIPLFAALPEGNLPPLSLLDEPKEQAKGYSPETLEALSRQVEIKLKDFRIEAQVVEVLPGPVITRFELQPAPGIKGSQISSLDKDIARGLSVTSVRIVDVIPGKSVIGLEIPNANRQIVYLSEILRSREYDKSSSPLTLALGKDIGGKPVVADLSKMPHLLVAGTTGAGKSVALNAMVLSLLYKASPKQVRIIMIDPKMLELSVYAGIGHLLAPVVTDMKEAANALRWCVAEMERRYKLMAAVGVRNLAGFNRKVKDAEDSGQPMLDPLFKASPDYVNGTAQPLEELPFIVVIIDEFADMMMVVGKKVEELIARLAQKARAAGIHLVLATQRPSVDVITGLIKANIPTRIAFQVSSKIDSRTILDQSGADQLLGHGDMLYLPPGTATPERIHGAFVDDHEVHAVVKFLKEHAGRPNYIPGVLEEVQMLGDGQVVGPTGLPEANALASSGEMDELYDQAVRIVTETRRASISGVQRRLKIGYNRAARLIEEMEAAGIVSQQQHNGNREVLAPPPPKD